MPKAMTAETRPEYLLLLKLHEAGELARDLDLGSVAALLRGTTDLARMGVSLRAYRSVAAAIASTISRARDYAPAPARPRKVARKARPATPKRRARTKAVAPAKLNGHAEPRTKRNGKGDDKE